MMKIKTLFFVLFALCLSAKAQDTTVSDEDLKKYAIAMDSIEGMKGMLLETISEMVKGNENVSAARYNELSKIIDDQGKLVEAKATEEEITFVKAVAGRKAEETAKINATFQSLAKDYVGAKAFNTVKKALNEDPAVKEKYNDLLEELKKSGEEN